jgi:transposase InsO family protein
MERAHLLGHCGGERVYKSLWDSGVYWPGMRADAERVAGRCDQCLRYNLGRRGYNPARSVDATYPMDHVAVDCFSLAITSPRGMNAVLVLVCVATRFVVLRALQDKSMQTMARTLWDIFCLLGFPKIMQSDNGREFVNQLLAALTDMLGVDHRLVAPYNPAANGVAESAVRDYSRVLKTKKSAHHQSLKIVFGPEVTKVPSSR